MPPDTVPPPTHSVERSLRRAGATVVAGVDEVGRGAWAGPVTVGAAVTGLRRPPIGLTDSKLLTPLRRQELAAVLDGWVTCFALGHAWPEEIDDLGMTAALRLAAVRALESLPVRPDAVILDGKHDYLGHPWRVRTVIKGDQSCVAVSAASVLAKVRRDALMVELAPQYEGFGFADNVGYPSPVHRAALTEHGPTPHHRVSWAYMDALPRWRHLKKTRTEMGVQDALPELELLGEATPVVDAVPVAAASAGDPPEGPEVTATLPPRDEPTTVSAPSPQREGTGVGHTG